MDKSEMKTGLYIVATPIGNIKDISPRGKETLREADIIACEDTRISKKLLSLLGIDLKKDYITLHDHNEADHLQQIISNIKEGKSVALISDAGSPLISDPGYKLIRECRRQDIYVTTIPGCCALICALQLSGMPTNSFMFSGFVPNKDKARKDTFLSVKDLKTTIIFYETAARIKKTLQAAKEIFNEREIAIVREISKVYEECLNGTAEELINHFEQQEPKGEMVLIIAPPVEKEKKYKKEEIIEKLKEALKKMSLKSAVSKVVEETKYNKKEIYELALRIKDEK